MNCIKDTIRRIVLKTQQDEFIKDTTG